VFDIKHKDLRWVKSATICQPCQIGGIFSQYQDRARARARARTQARVCSSRYW